MDILIANRNNGCVGIVYELEDEGGEWEAGGGLNLLLGTLGLAMGPRSANHRPKHA